MKLSVSIIFSALQESYPNVVLQKKTKSDNELSLQRPHFYSGESVFSPNQVYVVPQGQLPDSIAAKGHCLLILPELPRTCYNKSISVITVADTNMIALFNQVLTIFDRYSDWDESLQELIFQNAPIEEYLKYSLPFIGNPMNVHNNNFSYLAKVGNSQLEENHSHKSDFFDPDYLLRVDMQSSQSIFYSKDVIHFHDSCLDLSFFFLNLFDGNTVAGRLVVTSDDRPFKPQDGVLVKHLGKYLEAALTYAAFSGSGKNLRRDSLLEYLSGKAHSDDRIIQLKTISPFSKLKEDQHLYCLAGVYQDSDIPAQYISYQFEHALPESVSVLFDSKIVVLCANQPKQTPAAFFEEVSFILEKYSITAGCSNPFTDFFDLKYCYRQAEFTLQLMGSKQSGKALHHFKDHTLEHFLQFGCSILPVRLICASCIMNLVKHDKTAAVSYCDSLRIYLNTGMNSTETARQLNIKRNTFLARLERILRYIDLDLEDENDRLYLQISLRLIQKSITIKQPPNDP